MAWTYNPANLSTSLRDQVRLRIGDTDKDAPLLQDEEIDFALTIRNQDVALASYDCVRNILAKAANDVDFTLGPYSESHKERMNNLKALLKTLSEQSVQCAAPVSLLPETKPVFSYDMMSLDRLEDENNECAY